MRNTFNKNNYFILCLLNLSVILCAENSYASSDGEIGRTSSGSINISLVIPNLIKVSKLKDVHFNLYSGNGGLTSTSNFAVASNFKGSYRISATGNGPGGSFNLANGSSVLPYTFYFGRVGNSQLTELTAGVPLDGIAISSETINDTKENAKYNIKIKDQDLKNADVGEYSGAVTLIVTPE